MLSSGEGKIAVQAGAGYSVLETFLQDGIGVPFQRPISCVEDGYARPISRGPEGKLTPGP